MEHPAPLPPDLAALARASGAHVPLAPTTVRLAPDILSEIDALAARLNRADRGPVLRHLVHVGLATVAQQLAELPAQKVA